MRLCTATNWQDDFLRGLSQVRGSEASVHEVFGALPRSVAGSGRDAGLVPSIGEERARGHIALAHELGFRFNYLLNGSCMGGAEFSSEGRRSLEEYILWVRDAGADSVTVAIPLLAEVVRELAPELELVVSTITHVDTLRKAKMWEALGAQRITLSLMVNRDLRLLASMRKHLSCELELLANEMCMYGCPYRDYHYDLMAHGSQSGASLATIEYPHLKCTSHRMTDPGEILKARFIRPEDVARYEELGLDLIKLAGRGRSTRDLLHTARAYAARRYDGNFLDLTDLGFFDAPGAPRPEVSVDNRALDGFLDRVAGVDCDRACGVSCTLCDTLAKEIVSVQPKPAYMQDLVRAHQRILRKPEGS